MQNNLTQFSYDSLGDARGRDDGATARGPDRDLFTISNSKGYVRTYQEQLKAKSRRSPAYNRTSQGCASDGSGKQDGTKALRHPCGGRGRLRPPHGGGRGGDVRALAGAPQGAVRAGDPTASRPHL